MEKDSLKRIESETLRSTDAETPAPNRVPQWLRLWPRPRPHWTLQYVADRLGVAWYQLRKPDEPWLTHSMVRFLDLWLQPTDLLVEFGSGRSTLWFADRVGALISIEHHEEWHRQIADKLRNAGRDAVEYLRVDPHAEKMTGAAEATLRGRSVDVVLVDGPNRDHCALWALEVLRAGGLVIVDDSHRYLPLLSRAPGAMGMGSSRFQSEAWERFWGKVESLRRIHTTDGTKDCVAFISEGSP